MAIKKSILWSAPKVIKGSSEQTATKKNGWVRKTILKTGNYINNTLDENSAKIRQKIDLNEKAWGEMEKKYRGPVAQSAANIDEWNMIRKKMSKKR